VDLDSRARLIPSPYNISSNCCVDLNPLYSQDVEKRFIDLSYDLTQAKYNAMAPDPTQEMIRAKCTHSYCKLCHGDRQHIKNAGTASARSRNIAIYYDQQRKVLQSPSAKIPANKMNCPKRGTQFLDLPTEIRLQIYASCLEKSNQCIFGSIEGGGDHADFRRPIGEIRLWASHRFPVSILLANKAICKEARQEIYRLINFRLESQSPAELKQVQYWLTKHPLRYATSFEIPIFVCPSGLSPFGFTFRANRNPKMTRDHIVCLARMISHMPNLRYLDIELSITREIKIQRLSHKRQHIMLSLLFLLRELVPTKVQLRLVADRFLHPNKLDHPVARQNNVNIELAELFLTKERFQILKSSGPQLGVGYTSRMWRIWGEKPEFTHIGERA
jgi:hypothetical protein